MRKPVKLTEGQKAGAIRYEVKELTGLRKFFETTASTAGVNLAWTDMLMGHSIGLKKHYHKPTDQDLLEGKDRFAGYVAAIDSLTINDDHRLKQKVKQLETEHEVKLQKMVQNMVAEYLDARIKLRDEHPRLTPKEWAKKMKVVERLDPLDRLGIPYEKLGLQPGDLPPLDYQG